MGGRHRQARLGAVHRRAIDRLAEAEVRAGPGVRDRWGHRPEGLADRPGSHPGRLPRGRRARVRGEGGDRLQPGAAPGASEEAGSPGAGHTAIHRRDRAPAGQGRSLGQAGPGGAGRVRRVDPRRPAPPSAVPGTTDGQGSPRGRPGATRGAAVTDQRRVRVGRRTITITRPDKVLFPDDGITKADLVDHYVRVAGVMLPHVRGRPVSMKRYPEGIEGQVFYQKRVPDWFPHWIPHVEVRTSKGPHVYAVIADAATLAFLANQACIEPHTWLSRADSPDHPDLVVFDLDPSADDLPMLRRGARAIRRLLDKAGLVPFVKTSGSKGYHVVAPLDRSADHETVRMFAEGVAEVAVDRHPDVFTTQFRKAKRGDLVFLDVMRNGYGATVIPPYAVGSTALGEGLDPEVLRRVMTTFFERMRAVLERHGGSVEKYIGDAIVAVFGIPEVHEDDALRAVRAAWEMRGALDELNEELAARHGVRIETRTGINTGEVLAEESRAAAPLTAEPPHTAARLEQAAPPGGILLGDPTYRLVRDAVTVEPSGDLELRGKAKPPPAWGPVGVAPQSPGVARRLH